MPEYKNNLLYAQSTDWQKITLFIYFLLFFFEQCVQRFLEETETSKSLTQMRMMVHEVLEH